MNFKEMENRWEEELPTEANGFVKVKSIRKRTKPKKWKTMLETYNKKKLQETG